MDADVDISVELLQLPAGGLGARATGCHVVVSHVKLGALVRICAHGVVVKNDLVDPRKDNVFGGLNPGTTQSRDEHVGLAQLHLGLLAHNVELA